MGLIKDVKAGTIGTEAAKARDKGRGTFAAMLNTPMSQHGMSGGIDDWAVMIDAVEAEGWVLSSWSVAMDTKGRPQAYPVFRRSHELR